MNPVKPTNSKWAEIKEHGLLGRQIEPLFRPLFSQKNSKWFALLGLAILGIPLYWGFTYSGPYRYLAELELKCFGFYEAKLTAFLVMLGLLFGLLGIAVIVKLLFRGAERPASETQPSPLGRPTMAPAATPTPAVRVVEGWLRACQRAALYAAPLLVFGVGAYFYYAGTQEGDLQQLNAVDFETGKVQTRILYAEVRGYLTGAFVTRNDYRYMEMTSRRDAIGPARLVVGINDYEIRKYVHREADGAVTVRGVADKGLPGDVRYTFGKNGVAVAGAVWVVHAGRDPSWDRQMGLLIMALGVALAGLVFGWESYRKRKGAAAQAVRSSA